MKMRWKKICTLFGVTVLSYILICYFYQPTLNENFLELEKCPACYGESLCKHISNPVTEIILNYYKFNIVRVLNVRNVFFGEIASRKVVFKKLSQDWERHKIDGLICEAHEKTRSSRHSTSDEAYEQKPCHVGKALRDLLNFYQRNITLLIEKHPVIFDFSDAVKCSSEKIIETLLTKFKRLEQEDDDSILEHFVTLLAVNPEPLLFMAFSEEEPSFSDYLGACGRVAVFSFAGAPLTDVHDRPWLDRASYALQLLQMATRLSSGPIKLYLTDPRADNFVVDQEGKVRLVDAENIILVDSLTKGLVPTEHENDGIGCSDCLSFTYEELCEHTAADHNYFAVCKSLLSTTPFEAAIPEGLLHDAPPWVMTEFPFLPLLIEICSYPAYSAYRQLTGKILSLPSSLEQELLSKNSFGFISESARLQQIEKNVPKNCNEGGNSSAAEERKEHCFHAGNKFVAPNFNKMGRKEAAELLVSVLRTVLARYA